MIAMLEIIPNKYMPVFKKLGYITPRKMSAQLMLAGEIQLLKITHREHIRGVNWKGLENITEVKNWLLPSGLKPPENCSITSFEPRLLPPKLMENTAVSVLENADIKPSSLCVGIYPTQCSVIEPVIERAREIRILCDKYNEEQATRIMDKFGAAVICSSNDDIFSHCQLVIAPNDKAGRAKASKNALLFSPAENQRQALHVHSTLPQAPEVYAYPVSLFGAIKTLGALYEIENRHELGLITPSLAKLHNGLVTAPELSRYLKTLTI